MSEGVRGNILIVDDEPTALKVLTAILEAENFQVFEADGVDSAVQALENNIIDSVVTDMKMPGKTGLDLFRYIQEHHHYIPVVFLTAYGTVEAAVSMMDAGAYHYFVKPPDFTALKQVLINAVDQCKLKRRIFLVNKEREEDYRSHFIMAESSALKRIDEIIHTIRNSSCNVLVSGETGTGKELIARALHYSGTRSRKPFVAVNCAAIPHELIEAELFGHEKGAFTGAYQRRVGRIEAAAGGTLFLDEIGELDPAVQSKFLRVLQEREFSRLGDNHAIEVDFRLIASTNRDLRKEINAGRFREDLFYRLNVVCIDVPPLRQRKADIELLCKVFAEEFCSREGKLVGFTDDSLQALQEYCWPGNVRELRNVIEALVVLAKGKKITIDNLPENIQKSGTTFEDTGEISKTLQELEEITIRRVLQQCEGNKSKAARILGVSRKTLYQKIKTTSIH